MKAIELPSLEYLNECFELSEESPSGLIWKPRPRKHFPVDRIFLKMNTMYAGKPAGRIATQRGKVVKYWRIQLNGTNYFLHRIVWAVRNNTLNIPEDIDHKDNNGLNNKEDNLREATHGQNQANRGKTKSNTSGFKGVRQEGVGFRARIRQNGRLVHLGTFVSPEAAHEAYCAAALRIQGEFSRTA